MHALPPPHTTALALPKTNPGRIDESKKITKTRFDKKLKQLTQTIHANHNK